MEYFAMLFPFVGENRTLHLFTSDVQVGDEVYNFPDPDIHLRFKITQLFPEYDSVEMEYIEHPKGLFIGNKREWHKKATGY